MIKEESVETELSHKIWNVLEAERDVENHINYTVPKMTAWNNK